MPTYILLSNLTDEGAKTIKRNPRRIKEVNTELEKLGVKVLAQYAVLGPYDFVNIVEAADNTAVCPHVGRAGVARQRSADHPAGPRHRHLHRLAALSAGPAGAQREPWPCRSMSCAWRRPTRST